MEPSASHPSPSSEGCNSSLCRWPVLARNRLRVLASLALLLCPLSPECLPLECSWGCRAWEVACMSGGGEDQALQRLCSLCGRGHRLVLKDCEDFVSELCFLNRAEGKGR